MQAEPQSRPSVHGAFMTICKVSGDRLPIAGMPPDSVTITRERRPFGGSCDAGYRWYSPQGVLFALACLPDGSRALILAQWTDWDEGQGGSAGVSLDDRTGSLVLGNLGDLLRLSARKRPALPAARRRSAR
jgi:hypothetical protein